MQTTNIFEEAIRRNLTFDFKGQVTIQQLYASKDLAALEEYEAKLNEQVEKFGKRTRKTTTAKSAEQETLELQLAIVSRILDVKLQEIEDKKLEKENKDYNASLDALIYEKQQEALKSLSIEELKKLKK
jgi:hypothetical protein